MTTPTKPIPESRKGQPVPASLLRVAAEGPQVFERTHDGTLFVSSQYIAAYTLALQEAARKALWWLDVSTRGIQPGPQPVENVPQTAELLRAVLPEHTDDQVREIRFTRSASTGPTPPAGPTFGPVPS